MFFLLVFFPVILGTGVPLLGVQSGVEQEWNQFLGPHANGKSDAVELPGDLSDPNALAWKADVQGRGWSSPLILGDEIWLTTAIEIEATGEEREKMMAEASIEGMSAWASVELHAICLEKSTGEIRHDIELFNVEYPPLIHSLNSFASPTPVADGERVYCHFGTFGTAAVDRKTGKVIWRNEENVIDHETGPGSSPILNGDQLIFHCDGRDAQYVCALDRKTGEQAWRTDRSGSMDAEGMYKKAFCTPIVIERGGHEELVSPAANWVYGYDPASGKELWRVSYGHLGFSNVARPFVDGTTLYVCSGFMQSTLMAIDLSGAGPPGEKSIEWTYQEQVPNISTPVLIDGAIYFVSDRGILTCVDADSGQRLWRERLGRGHSSSPLLADGRLYFGDHDGKLHVIRPDRDGLDLLKTIELDAQIMASPAAVDHSLFVRTADSMYHFRKP